MFPTKVKVLRRLLQVRHTLWGSHSFGKAPCSRLVLGIETSCDETGAAVLDETGEILGESLHSQKEVHLRWVSALYSVTWPLLQGFCCDMSPSLFNSLNAGLVASSPQWPNSYTGKT